ncbi:MAG: hypothetical protein KGH75_00095 [Rhodospirillales bacterium]|nr:hypothetical protein [Rhodospirillales bacterium]
MAARLIIDGARMAELLRGPKGAVFSSLTRRGDMLIHLAQTQILTTKKTRDDEARLEASIVKRMSESETGLVCTVIAGAGLSPNYAYWVHEGNGPPGGRIYATNHKFLVFEGRDGSEVFVSNAPTRNRPQGGVATSKPNRYLSDNLPKVMAHGI